MYSLLQIEWTFWDYVLNFNAFFVSQVVLGVVTILICITLKRFKADKYNLVTTHGLIFFQIFIGSTVAFLGAYQIRMDLNTGHVLLDGLYFGWQNIWLAVIVSIITILILVLIEVFNLDFHKKAVKRTGDTK